MQHSKKSRTLIKSFEILAALSDNLEQVHVNEDPDPYDNDTPREIVMASISKKDCQAVYDWATKKFPEIPRKNMVHPDKYHITIIATTSKFKKQYPLKENIIVPVDITSTKLLGPNKDTLVLLVKSPWLMWRYKVARMCGGTSTWPTYIPHITIASDVGKYEPANFHPFTVHVTGETLSDFQSS